MIFGIGTDIVSVDRISDSIDKLGSKFALRILTDNEYKEFSSVAQPANFLAKRFAAKEAVAKAFGTGFRDGLSLRHIEVTHDSLGKPQLVFYGYAIELINNLGIGESHLSLSDEKQNALAFVVLMKV